MDRFRPDGLAEDSSDIKNWKQDDYQQFYGNIAISAIMERKLLDTITKSYDKQLNNWVKSKKLSKATNIDDDIVNDNDIIYDINSVNSNHVIDVRNKEATTVVAEALNKEIGTGTVTNKIEHDFVDGERNGGVEDGHHQ